MSISDPEKLVAEFKKSGEFDRLRRELLQQFKDHEGIGTFMSRVQDIVQQRLAEDERLHYLPPEAVHNELMQDMDRFPLVQRTVADLPALTDPAFSASIRRSLARLLNAGNGKQPDGKRATNGDVDVDMNDDNDSHSEGSGSDFDSDSDASNDNDGDDDENENEPESEDEAMPMSGIEQETKTEDKRGRPTSKVEDREGDESRTMNGVNDIAKECSPSSSPVNRPRAQLETEH